MRRSGAGPDEKLGDELFLLVEKTQGRAYISDGIIVLSRKEVFSVARGALKNHRIAVQKLTKWLKKHNEY